jgi:hypothetical protein
MASVAGEADVSHGHQYVRFSAIADLTHPPKLLPLCAKTTVGFLEHGP